MNDRQPYSNSYLRVPKQLARQHIEARRARGEPLDPMELWMILEGEKNYADKMLRDQLIRKGEVLTSERNLAERCGRSASWVHNMIETFGACGAKRTVKTSQLQGTILDMDKALKEAPFDDVLPAETEDINNPEEAPSPERAPFEHGQEAPLDAAHAPDSGVAGEHGERGVKEAILRIFRKRGISKEEEQSISFEIPESPKKTSSNGDGWEPGSEWEQKLRRRMSERGGDLSQRWHSLTAKRRAALIAEATKGHKPNEYGLDMAATNLSMMVMTDAR